jgi:hypothetical protein
MKTELVDIHNDSKFDTNANNLSTRNSHLKSIKTNEKKISVTSNTSDTFLKSFLSSYLKFNIQLTLMTYSISKSNLMMIILWVLSMIIN